MSNNNQQQLADDFSDTIDGFLSQLADINLEEQKSLSKKVHDWTVVAAVLPLIMAGISTFLVFLTKEALTSLTSLFDVVPPLYVTRAKTNLDDFSELFQVKNNLELLRGRINRLALMGKLEGDVLEEIENELKQYAKFFAPS